MVQRILFVRAVNVGGATMPMAEFRTLLTDLGATSAVTLIASGNAVIEIDMPTSGSTAEFDRRVEAGITDRFGFTREVISRSVSEVAAARTEHPLAVADLARSYVCFLGGVPTAEAIDAARLIPTGDDEWSLGGRDLHVRYAAGAGRADLDLNRLLRALGVVGTARNLRTVDRIHTLALSSTNR